MKRCEMGDMFEDGGGGDPSYEPCMSPGRYRILTAGNATTVCRRHAEEVREVADDIWPALPIPEVPHG